MAGLRGGLVLLKIFPTVKGPIKSLLMKSVGGSKFGGAADPHVHKRGHWENTEP